MTPGDSTPEEGTLQSTASQFAQAMDRVSDQSVQLQEIPNLTLIRIEIDPNSRAAVRLQKVLGVSFPRHAGEATGDRRAMQVLYGTRQIVACLWVHDDIFLVVSRVDHAKLGRALDSALGTDEGLILDVSWNRSVIELSGPDAADVLSRTVSVEEVPEYFDVGMALRANVADSELMLWRVDTDQYLLVPRSSHTGSVMATMFDAIYEVKES